MARKATQADILRLGADVAAIKAKASPKDWAALVKRAHARGFTVRAELSGQPDALKERLQSSLKAQAQKSIADAYAPTEKQLTADETRIAAWDEKRKQDNASYETWLAAQRQKQDATLAGAASLINQQQQQIADDTKTAWAGARAGAQAAVAQQPGVVSDMSQSKALDFGAAAARGNQMVDNARQTSNAVVAAGLEQQRGTNQAMLAQAGAREAQRYADTSKARKDILDTKSKLAVSKATDYLKEFTRLQDAEVTKANSNRDFSALTEKLGIQQGSLDLKSAALNHTIEKDTTAASQNAESIAIRKGKLLLDQGKADLNSDGKVNSKDYKLKKQIDGKYGKDNKPSKGETATSIKAGGLLSEAYGMLVDLHSQYDKKVKGAHTPDTFRHVLTTRGVPKAYIDIAEDARIHGGKLSARGRKLARQLGIINPQNLVL